MARWEPWDDDYYGRYYPPSRPLPAKGGIKARSQRGEFAASWWGQRWLAVLESFGLGARLNRGRSYARRGQVVHLEIKEGELVARVQGSRADPYTVHIRLKQIGSAQRKKLGAALAEDIAMAARLMAGELPGALEGCFAKVGAPLFPERANIGVAAVPGPRLIRLRVWERGAGETRACGSAACAALVAAHRRGLTRRQATVALIGGDLDILWRDDGHVLMTGPAALVFEGSFDAALLAG